MELFQVTLKRGEDIQAFYDDMETPGGALHIPERKVECANRRPTSRTTGYMPVSYTHLTLPTKA